MTLARWFAYSNPWIYLAAAGAFEIGFTTFMKLSNGFRNWRYDVCFAVCALLSFGLLNLATRELALGTAYAVWTGIGAAGTAIIGIMFFHEPTTFWRLMFLAMLITSLVGLRFVS